VTEKNGTRLVNKMKLQGLTAERAVLLLRLHGIATVGTSDITMNVCQDLFGPLCLIGPHQNADPSQSVQSEAMNVTDRLSLQKGLDFEALQQGMNQLSVDFAVAFPHLNQLDIGLSRLLRENLHKFGLTIGTMRNTLNILAATVRAEGHSRSP
jgi:hypothetical protein